MTTAATGEATVNTVHDLLKYFAQSAVRAYFPETDKHGNPSLARFFFDNGRLPYATDNIKPWVYRGWVIPYLQMCEAHPQIAPRYDYVLRTLDAGHLLDEPLPQIHFVGEFDQRVKPGLKMLNDLLAFVERQSGSWNGMRDLCEWLGYALGVTHEPSKLPEPVQEHLYKNFNLEPLLLNPSDYLGQMLCETNHGKRNGFYPTPINIVTFMTELVAGCAESREERRDRRGERMTDPCVGTGRMMMVASNFSMRLYGQDIDPLCCLIAKINLALYAPWYYIPDSYFSDEPVTALSEPDETTIETVETNKAEFSPIAAQNEPIAEQPETLFEQLRRQKETLKKGKLKTQKIYTTEIEEPPLF